MASTGMQAAIDLARKHQGAGQLDQAQAICRQALTEYPDSADVLDLLGTIAYQRGQHQEAADLIGRAIAVDPSQARYHNNLGLVLLAMDQPQAAIDALHRAIQLKPDFADAHYNLGFVHQLQQKRDPAIQSYRAAIQFQPEYVEAMNNLASLLLDGGEVAQAYAILQTAIRIRPDLAEVHSNLAKLLHEQGQLNASLAASQTALQLNPGLASAHNRLANTLRRLGHLDAAETSYIRAITLKPDYAEGYCNLGSLKMEKARLNEAIESFRRAVSIQPTAHYFHSNLIFAMQFHSRLDSAQIARELAQWRREHAEALERDIAPHANTRDAQRPLRVGFVSPDFREHCQSFFTLPLFANRDRNQFQYICYDDSLRPDRFTQRLKENVEGWRRIVGMSDEAVAQLVRSDHIDILVDLALHMERNCLLVFARKPAPVQATWLGYPGSTGLKTIDYRISDPYLDPPGCDESEYSEQTLRLADSFWCYDPWCENLPVQASPHASGAPFTFGSLNNFVKLNQELLELWAQVLRAVPGSRLLLLSPEGSCRQWVLDVLASGQIAPQRVLFAPFQPRVAYLRLYHQIDIVLDTFPYNGHTTTIDALWMGVPVVSLAGQRAVSRGALSVLSNVRLPELVASSPTQFVQIAAELAQDRSRLNELRSTMRQRLQASPLMDGPRFARNMEAAFRTMWRRWCS